ncbi:hypothetical protein [Actinomyces ruminicola]|uniref:hypothetical protein n=1 Tax=Actinomyces ruminicola TaxID=332524 RepID=UPI0011C72059|nr:hypothetical protein [Actinomyces ruminicola]
MSAYETEDGEPRYGKRLSPQELAVHLRRQGIEPPVVSDPAAGRRAGAAHADAVGGTMPPRPRRRRTLGIGLVLMLLVAPMLLIGGVMTVLDGSPTRGTPLGEDGTVYLDAGTTVGLYGTSTRATSGCAVTDPDGVAIILDTPEAGAPYAIFAAGGAGVYTVSCPSGTNGVVVGPTMKLDRVPAAALLILGAGATGVAGLVVAVVGAARARR